jgi:hypothetical protein
MFRLWIAPLLVAATAALFAIAPRAQVVAVPAGCTVPNGGTAAAPNVTGTPTRGDLSFAIDISCPAGSDGVFAMLGLCHNPSQPFSNFGLPNTPCGGTGSGANCRLAVQWPNFVLLGQPVPPTPAVFALPLPNNPTLQGVTLCMQFLCWNLAGSACTQISQGVQFTIL